MGECGGDESVEGDVEVSAVAYAKPTDAARLNPTLGGRLPEDDLVSFVPMASLSAETATIKTTQELPCSEVSEGFTPFLSGDVLVAKITPCFENGKIAQAVLDHIKAMTLTA